MNVLEKLIAEQDNLNTWIEEKVKKLRDHQDFLDKVLVEKFTDMKLEHVKKTSERKSHIFTYNELSIEIEIQNPVDRKELTLSEAVTKRLTINIWIKRKIEAISKKGPIAIASIIKTVNAFFDKNKNGFLEEVTNFGALTKTADFIEGATAFAEKRMAIFKNK